MSGKKRRCHLTVGSEKATTSRVPLSCILTDLPDISQGHFNLEVDGDTHRLFHIISHGLRCCLAEMLFQRESPVIHLRGGAVLNLLQTGTKSLSKFKLDLNDLDFYIEDMRLEDIHHLAHGFKLLKMTPTKTIEVVIGQSNDKDKEETLKMVFTIQDVIVFSMNNFLFKLETTVNGTTWNIDLSNNLFSSSRTDYYANTIPILYSNVYPQGLLKIAKIQLVSLLSLIHKEPQPCVIFEKNSRFSRNPKDLENLFLSLTRIVKATQKGYLTRSVGLFKPEEKCPICQDTRDTGSEKDQQENLHHMAINLKCGHSLCAMCYYIMHNRFCQTRSYDEKCPLCRKEIELAHSGYIELSEKEIAEKVLSANLNKEWFNTLPDFPESQTSVPEKITPPVSLSLVQRIKSSIEEEYPGEDPVPSLSEYGFHFNRRQNTSGRGGGRGAGRGGRGASRGGGRGDGRPREPSSRDEEARRRTVEWMEEQVQMRP